MADLDDAYLAAARALPRPTEQETERFARYVSGAHSWYKHLPLHPKVPFVFYLDPQAGKSLVRTAAGETALVEVTDQSPRFHYTWQTTRDYRRRFGYWNYHASYGTSFHFPGEGGVVNTAGPGLKILTEEGDWAPVPAHLVERGKARVSALVHPWPNFAIWALAAEHFGLTEDLEREVPGAPSTPDPVLRRLWGLLQREERDNPGPTFLKVVEQAPRAILEAIREAIRKEPLRPAWLWPDEHNWEWPHPARLEELRRLGVAEPLIPALLRFCDLERMRSSLDHWYVEAKKRQGRPDEVLSRVIDAIPRERSRQLEAMTQAMTRFADAVHG